MALLLPFILASSLFVSFASDYLRLLCFQLSSAKTMSSGNSSDRSSESSFELVLVLLARRSRWVADQMNAANSPSSGCRPASRGAGPVLGSSSLAAPGPHVDGTAVIDLEQPSSSRTFCLRRIEHSDDEGIPLEYLRRYIPSNSGELAPSHSEGSLPSEPRQTESGRGGTGIALKTRSGDESAPVVSAQVAETSGAASPRRFLREARHFSRRMDSRARGKGPVAVSLDQPPPLQLSRLDRVATTIVR